MLHLTRWLTGREANDWLAIAVLIVFIIIAALVISMGVNDNIMVIEYLITMAGVIGSVLLFRITKSSLVRIWHSGAGKVVLGLFSLCVITVARILADYQITVTTGTNASLFPRAQDVLTLLFAALLWFFVMIIILGVVMLVSQIVSFLFLFIGDQLNLSAAKFVGNRVGRVFISALAVVLMIGLQIERTRDLDVNIFEYVFIYSSFVPNMAMPVHLGSPPATHQLCPSQPEDAWLAFVRDDAVMVALPATSDPMQGGFTYLWGQCGRERLR